MIIEFAAGLGTPLGQGWSLLRQRHVWANPYCQVWRPDSVAVGVRRGTSLRVGL